MYEWLRNLFKRKLKDGKHFTREDKNEILGLLDNYKQEVLFCQLHGYKCGGMCWHLKFFCRCDYLCELYHNREFYNGKTKVTYNNLYYWSRKDYGSRLKAIDLLRNAVLND